MTEAANEVYWVTPSETKPLPEKIDWDCPCLAHMKANPCFSFFKEAIECVGDDPEKADSGACTEPLIALEECLKAQPEPM